MIIKHKFYSAFRAIILTSWVCCHSKLCAEYFNLTHSILKCDTCIYHCYVFVCSLKRELSHVMRFQSKNRSDKINTSPGLFLSRFSILSFTNLFSQFDHISNSKSVEIPFEYFEYIAHCHYFKAILILGKCQFN